MINGVHIMFYMSFFSWSAKKIPAASRQVSIIKEDDLFLYKRHNLTLVSRKEVGSRRQHTDVDARFHSIIMTVQQCFSKYIPYGHIAYNISSAHHQLVACRYRV